MSSVLFSRTLHWPSPCRPRFTARRFKISVSPIELVDFLVPNETEFIVQHRPFFFVETGEDKVRPALAFGFCVRKQVDTAEGMRAGLVALERRSAKDLAQPAQVKIFRKRFAEVAGPGPGQAVNFAPMLFPTELEKNLVRLREEFGQGRVRGKKLNFLQATDECGMALGAIVARAVFPEEIDVIDEHVAVSPAQQIFHLRDRYSLKNLRARRAQKSEQDFQPGTLL